MCVLFKVNVFFIINFYFLIIRGEYKIFKKYFLRFYSFLKVYYNSSSSKKF